MALERLYMDNVINQDITNNVLKELGSFLSVPDGLGTILGLSTFTRVVF